MMLPYPALYERHTLVLDGVQAGSGRALRRPMPAIPSMSVQSADGRVPRSMFLSISGRHLDVRAHSEIVGSDRLNLLG
jgi:hypothetical protein